MVPLLQQGPYRDTPTGPVTASAPVTAGRQIGAKASTQPVALRVRPRLREHGSTLSEPQTKAHSCVVASAGRVNRGGSDALAVGRGAACLNREALDASRP